MKTVIRSACNTTLVLCIYLFILVLFAGPWKEIEEVTDEAGRPVQVSLYKRHLSQLGDSAAYHHHDCLHELPKNVTDSVRKFLFFVGYARSGHSIIGSILDAHSNVIIAHEYSVLHRWLTMPEQHKTKAYLYSAIYNNSCYNSNRGLRRSSALKKGYTLHIDGLWQGIYTGNISVIGDKSGGMTTNIYKSKRKKILRIYKEMERVLKVPVIAVHVVRNPYDNIATMLLYNNRIKKTDLSITRPYSNPIGLELQIESYFRKVASVINFIQDLHLDVIEIHNVDLINDPVNVIESLCDKLELVCSKKYITVASEAVFKHVSRSRHLIKWSPELIDVVRNKSKNYQFLRRYSFFD